MSKELAFTDDNDVVKYLDTTTAFNLALTADGVAFDLTNAKSVLVKIANDDGYIMQQTIALTTVTSPLGGTLSFPINQDIMNTLVPDDYDIEVWVTMKDGTQAIFPSDGTLGFSIEENLMSDTGEVIPTITLNDFQQQFDDLSSQMENAVHNVHKGDQGNPGNGIKSANNQYQLSDSPVTVPTGGWSFWQQLINFLICGLKLFLPTMTEQLKKLILFLAEVTPVAKVQLARKGRKGNKEMAWWLEGKLIKRKIYPQRVTTRVMAT